MRRKHPITFIVFLALLAEIFYFLPIDVPYKLCFVAGILFLGSLGFISWKPCLAFLFSCAGDFMGSSGNFTFQLLFFLFAHVLFASFFISKIVDRGLGISLGKTIIGLIPLLASLILIIPDCPAGMIQILCIIYMLCICTMLWSAIQQGSTAVSLGAALFLLSDFVLAWNKFKSPIPFSRYFVLVPYFSGQIFLYLGICRLKMKYIASRR